MTINSSCKDVGGLSGNTQSPGATERWTKIHHHIVALREHLNNKVKKKTKERHLELGTSRIERDEEDVSSIITYIYAWLPELWGKDHPITSFAAGEIATDDVKDDIIDLRERGEISRDEFVGRFTQENAKLSYYDPIKRQSLKLFEKKTTKKKHLKTEDEGQSFTNIFTMCNEKKLDLRKIMDYYVTSKPWVIINKDEKNRNNNKHLFQNHLQNLSSIPKTHKAPDNISTSIVTSIRMISFADLKPRTYKLLPDEIKNCLSSMPGNNLRVIFDNYSYKCSVPSKQKYISQMESLTV